MKRIEHMLCSMSGFRPYVECRVNAGGAALLITLLCQHNQELVSIAGHVVHHAFAAYRGNGKSDAKGAAVIADQARSAHDLRPFRQRDVITVDLRMLCVRPVGAAAPDSLRMPQFQ